MNNDDISTREDWDELKESVDEKDLLLRQTFAIEQILAELQRINGAEQSEPEQQYQCNQCGSIHSAAGLEKHAKSCFNWMGKMGNVKKHYKEL